MPEAQQHREFCIFGGAEQAELLHVLEADAVVGPLPAPWPTR